MNKENLLKVAAAIENHTLALGFNMGNFEARNGTLSDQSGHNCKTTCCIGGWAGVIANHEGFEPSDWGANSLRAKNWLELTTAENNELFFCNQEYKGENQEYKGKNLQEVMSKKDELWFINIKPEQAVEVLRHAAKHGEIDWTRVLLGVEA